MHGRRILCLIHVNEFDVEGVIFIAKQEMKPHFLQIIFGTSASSRIHLLWDKLGNNKVSLMLAENLCDSSKYFIDVVAQI